MQQVSGHGQQKRWNANRAASPAPAPAVPTTIEGMWILLIANEGELTVTDPDGRVPMMARAGDDKTYLLAFKNVAKARQFLSVCEAPAEPRMVVRGNKADIFRICESVKVAGVLVDYDPSTQHYAFAIELG